MNNNIINEVWKDVKGYEGLYQVSNLGRVKSLKYGKERILKAGENTDKYLCVNLCKDGKVKNYKIHRIVAQAFLDNYSDDLEVDHIDTNRQNNNVENLKMCSHKENTNNLLTKKHNGEAKRGKNSPIARAVICIETNKTYSTVTDCAKELGLSGSHISAVCRGKRNHTGGYHFKYVA